MRRWQVKKFFLITLTLILLLTSGIVPAAVQADSDQAENPESWLNDEEKAFVASIRAADSAVRGVIADITWLLWNYTADKNLSIQNSFIMLGGTLKQFCTITAPEEFQQIGQDYCSTATSYLNVRKPGLSPADYHIAGFDIQSLHELVYTLIATQNTLDELEGDLNRLGKKLTAKIADVAQQRKEAVQLLEALFGKYCFIATAAYGTPSAEEINVLRRFRDQALLPDPLGKAFVGFYYEHSPPLAEFISEHEWLRTLVRECIVDPAVDVVECTEEWWGR